jgi:hypothetical protein
MNVRIPVKRGMTRASSGRWCGWSDTRVSLAQPCTPDFSNGTGRIGGMWRVGTTLLIAGLCAACGSSHSAPRLYVADAHLGLDCGDAFPCPHLGIAVWLKAPASRVTVTLHGRRVALVTHRRYEYRRAWLGFVRDPVAERLAADMNQKVRLTVEATGRDGTLRRAMLTSPVSSGWG